MKENNNKICKLFLGRDTDISQLDIRLYEYPFLCLTRLEGDIFITVCK